MKYEVGQKVVTPHGDGVIISMSEIDNEYEVEYAYKELTTSFFGIESLQPYKTPHEKLVEMGFEIHNGKHTKSIISDSGYHILIHKKSKEIGILGKALTFDLWKIFAEYLEWLEEEK